MKKKFLLISSILLTLIAFSGQAWSTSVKNTPNDSFEDYSDGSIFDYYQNSGALVGVYSGNDNDLDSIEDNINAWYRDNYDKFATISISTNDLRLSITGWNSSKDQDVTIGITKDGEEYKVDDVSSDYYSGTWMAFDLDDNSAAISFYIVKASTAFAIYYLDPAASEGSWSVYDIDASGVTNGKGVKSISHLTGFIVASDITGGGDPVPEPTTMILFGLGLLGLAKISRRKK